MWGGEVVNEFSIRAIRPNHHAAIFGIKDHAKSLNIYTILASE